MFNRKWVLVITLFSVLLFFHSSFVLKPYIIPFLQMGIKDGEATLSNVGPKDYRGNQTFLIVFKAKAMNFSDEERYLSGPA